MKEVSDTAKKTEKRLLHILINPNSIKKRHILLISELYNSQPNLYNLQQGCVEILGGSTFNRPTYKITTTSEDGTIRIIQKVKFTNSFFVHPTVLINPESIDLVEVAWLAYVHEQHPETTLFTPHHIYLSKLPDQSIVDRIYHMPFRVSNPIRISRIKELDPRALTTEGKNLLLLLFKQYSREAFFDGCQSVIQRCNKYIIPDNNQHDNAVTSLQVITLKYSLIRYIRKKSEGLQEFSYAVLNNDTNICGFESRGYCSNATIKVQNVHDSTEIVFKEKPIQKWRFIKLFVPSRDQNGHLQRLEDGSLIDSRTQNDKAVREWQFLNKISIFAVKDPVITNDNSRAALIMRHFEGYPLINYMIEDYGEIKKGARIMNGGNTFTVNQRIEISIMAGEAIITYVHDYGIINRDIKPDNMMLKIDEHNNPLQIRIVDFGYAKWENEKNLNEICGTKQYKSPESIEDRQTTKKSDAYSYAIMLDLLWDMIFSYRKFGALSDEHKLQISAIIARGTENNMDKRASIDSIVADFKRIKEERAHENQLKAHK